MSPAVIGVIANAIQTSADRDLLQPKRLRDPAEAIAEHLLIDLAKHFSLTIVDAHQTSEGVQSDLVLVLQTTRWAVTKGKLSGVGVAYEGKLTLLDARSNQVLVEGTCVFQPVDGTSVEELSREPRTLQDEVYGVADVCLDDFRHHVLNF